MSQSAWTRRFIAMVGGLTEIGFDAEERYLLIISHSGRGLLDASTGARLAREPETPTLAVPWLRRTDRLALGIGPADGIWFPVVGLWGGSLPAASGPWRLAVEREGRYDVVVMSSAERAKTVLVRPATEVRVCGFTRSGRAVVATTSEVEVFETV